MTAFAVAAVVIAALALALLARPFWTRRGAAASRRELSLAVHRDQLRELDADLAAGTLAQADYDRARMEVEKRALEEAATEERAERRTPPRAVPARAVAAIAVALPLVAILVYLAVGNLRALDPSRVAGAPPGMREIEAMVQKLADRLEKEPEDVEGWKMLGRSYSVMGRYPEAVRAYSRAAAKAPRDADLLAELADALAMARGQNLQGEPEELVLRALQIDPKNLKALALAGTAAFGRDDFAGAVRYWSRMLAEVPAGTEDARAIQANIDEARAMAAQKMKPAGEKKAPAAAALTGTVSLSPKLAGQVSPDDTVFIFARATEGPPMPLAAVRRKVRELPYAFRLDDSMAMTPAAKLSGHAKVTVVARVSKSGTATAQRGDLQGASAPVASDARDVAVVIDSVVP
ncbi:MAG TPA: c-type cytochrome biogenesis protein CcmI [Burkholderiales bacterium]|nr:c-type cytochrome biogenesis protein CcmI [Burkholderiales bacterium]